MIGCFEYFNKLENSLDSKSIIVTAEDLLSRQKFTLDSLFKMLEEDSCLKNNCRSNSVDEKVQKPTPAKKTKIDPDPAVCNSFVKLEQLPAGNYNAVNVSSEDDYRKISQDKRFESKKVFSQRDLRRNTKSLKYDRQTAGDWANACKYDCKLCENYSTSRSNTMGQHLNAKHNTSCQEYHKNFGALMSLKAIHKCRICDSKLIHTSENIRAHLQSRHETSLPTYFNQYIKGSAESLDAEKQNRFPTESDSKLVKEFHNCVICNEKIAFDSFDIKQHCKNVHNIDSIKTYYTEYVSKSSNGKNDDEISESSGKVGPELISDRKKKRKCNFTKNVLDIPERKNKDRHLLLKMEASTWANKCSYSCKICCIEFKSSTSFLKHIKQKHELTTEEYKAKYGQIITRRPLHKCRICGSKITFTYFNITKHCQGVHKLDSTTQYYTDYIAKKSDSTIGSADVKNQTKTLIGLEQIQKAKKRKVNPEQHQPKTQSSSVPGDTMKQMSAWVDQCTYKCRVCDFTVKKKKQFSAHIETKHQLSLSDYKDVYGQIMSSRKLHTCALCNAEITFNRSCVTQHCMKTHKLPSLLTYYVKNIANKIKRSEKTLKTVGTVRTVKALGEGATEDEYVAREWANGCEYKCRICNDYETKKPGTFDGHLRCKHGISTAEYAEKFGSCMSLKATHVCNICGKEIVQAPTGIRIHLKVHNETLTSYFNKFIKSTTTFDKTMEEKNDAPVIEQSGRTGGMNDESDSEESARSEEKRDGPVILQSASKDEAIKWADQCAYECRICKFSIENNQKFYVHIRKAHQLTVASYITKYGQVMTIRKFHQCLLCDSKVTFALDNVSSHCKAQHQINSLLTYYVNYVLPNENGGDFALRGGRDVAIATDAADDCQQTEENQPEINEELTRDEDYEELEIKQEDVDSRDAIESEFVNFRRQNSNPELEPEPEPAPAPEPEPDTINQEIRDWVNQCIYVCRICDYYTLARPSYQVHLKKNHGLKLDDYKQVYYNDIYAKRVTHSCHICDVEVLHSSKGIRDHLEAEHQQTVMEYFTKFIKSTPRRVAISEQEVKSSPKKETISVSQDMNCSTISVEAQSFVQLVVEKWQTFENYECSLCLRFSSDTRRGHELHLIVNHGETVANYESVHGYITPKSTFHDCKICQKKINHVSDDLKSHFKDAHGLTVEQYYIGYIQQRSRPGDNRQPSWMERCVYACRVCNDRPKFTSRAIFLKHILSAHSLSLDQYISNQGDPLYESDLFHCKLCNETHFWEKDIIAEHLTKIHHTTPDCYHKMNQGSFQ